MNVEKTIANLEKHRFTVKFFETGQQASDYLVSQIKNTTVGIGGSVTAEQLGLYDRLSENNTVWTQGRGDDPKARDYAATDTKVFISSAHAITETGEIVNLDGYGNRVASTVYGKDVLYIVSGINKIVPDLDSAIDRTRNYAAPRNAKRLNKSTPCAVDGTTCFDCASPARICNALVVLLGPTYGIGRTEIILIGQPLGI